MDTWNLAYRPDSFWTRLRTRRLSVPVIAAAVLAVTLACSDSSGTITPPEPVPTTLTAVEGSGLQAPAGTVLPEGPTVQLRDQHGKPVAGVDVTFSVTAGGGSVVYPRVATDFLGRARTTWILGDEVGTPQTLMASVSSLSADFQAQVIQPVPGQSYHGRSEYVQFFPGELPVVLSAGHGGDLRPTEIPDRTVGTTVQDLNTLDLALRVRQTVKDQTGYWPHLVVSHLHRIKLDPNREIVEAAQGNPEAERAWWEYHTFLKKARHMVEAEFGEGFYIDLHGHGHTIQRLELGYLLSISQLALADEALRGVAGQSSLKRTRPEARGGFRGADPGAIEPRIPPGRGRIPVRSQPERHPPWDRPLLHRGIQHRRPRVQGRRNGQRRPDRVQLHRREGQRPEPAGVRPGPDRGPSHLLPGPLRDGAFPHWRPAGEGSDDRPWHWDR
jgi:hypothetical protein